MMDIEEIKARKAELEKDLRKLLNDFAEETKCDISYLDFDAYPSIGMTTTYIVKVKVEI